MSGFSSGTQAGPVIQIVRGELREMADQAMTALVRAGSDIYQRGGLLVRPALLPMRTTDGAAIKTPGIIPVMPAWLRRELGRVARWEKFDVRSKACGPRDPPIEVVEQIISAGGEWPFHVLTAVSGTPTMRSDGSLLLRPGYDAATGIMLLNPPPMLAIPDQPTKNDALAALQLLLKLLEEFPFTDEASRTVALSQLMTPTLRIACGEAVPMHCACAPDQGTGKSYLADLASMIVNGTRCPALAYPYNGEEFAKQLGAALIDGVPIISIDNVNGTLASDFLCQAIERPVLDVRLLGASKNVRVPNTASIFANGNNLRVAGDLTRRQIRGELDANCEAPEERTFAADPLGAVRADRGAYIAAILTIARAHIVAGRPNRPEPLPSFEGWSDLVRGSLIWLGQADPVATVANARAEDPARQKFAAVVEAWAGGPDASSTADLVKLATKTDQLGDLEHPEWAAALRAVALDRRAGLSADALGNWLRDHKGRRHGAWKLVREGSPTRPRWRRETLREANGEDTDAECGDVGACRGDPTSYAEKWQGKPTKRVETAGTAPTGPYAPTPSENGADEPPTDRGVVI